MRTTTTLQGLLDQQQIRELVLHYARAIDRRDLARVAALYHPDAIDDHGGYAAGPACEFLARLPAILDTMISTSHQIMNHLIEIDGDYAEGEVYTIAYHHTRDAQGQEIEVIAGGRYLDRYERRDGQWKFSYRKIVTDWNQVQPALCQWESPMFKHTARGAAGAADASHPLFRLIGH